MITMSLDRKVGAKAFSTSSAERASFDMSAQSRRIALLREIRRVRRVIKATGTL
jgi:hypothetical protein